MQRGKGQALASERRKAILDFLQEAGGGPVKGRVIMERLGIGSGYLSDLMNHLITSGLVESSRRGYSLKR